MSLFAQLLLFFMLLHPSFAQSRWPEEQSLQQLASQYLKAHKRKEHISAVAITVQVGYHKPVTVYASDSFTYLNPESLFQIGSITKSFVTALLLQLENDPCNHFNLDDPVDKFFPQYPKWHGITIRQLMNMTSGIPDYFKDPDIFKAYVSHPHQSYPMAPWVDLIYKKPLLFAPGSRFYYSNTNYFLLGMLVEKITGRTLEEEITTHFIVPLHLHHTYYVTGQANSSVLSHLIPGYQYENHYSSWIPLGTNVSDFSLSYMGPAGGMVSNTRDVTKWIHALFTPDVVLNECQFNQLISLTSEKTAKSVDQLSFNDPQGYGLGISKQYEAPLKTTFYIYQGETLGYRAIYAYVPDKKISITIMVNSSFDGGNDLITLIDQIGALVI